MSAPHTEGPWRWEFNPSTKSLSLVGGRPQFDKTVMNFVRRGMNGALPMFRDTAEGGFDLLHRADTRADWLAKIPGREHHASWIVQFRHPDADLIAGAAEMFKALDQIGGLSRALRSGGPAPEDLEELSDALSEAVDTAHAAIAAVRGEA